jgi:O-acetyl-ADP-ribose deacetylase (regulator of RNase III)
MVTYHDGDLLESGCQLICHQVNEYGVMGAGIALQIKEKFPTNFVNYTIECAIYKKKLYGNVFFYKDKQQLIANCFSQIEWQTDYELVKKVCVKLLQYCRENKIKTIGIPFKYGCGLAGGDWNIVEKIFKDTFEKEKFINLQIWRYEC